MLLKSISPCYNHGCNLLKHLSHGSSSTLLRRCSHGLVKSTQEVNAILTNIDNDLKEGAKTNFSSTLRDLVSVNASWPEALGGQQNLLGSVANGLLQHKAHNEIDNLVHCLLGQGYVFYEGLATTILKSYIEQKEWKKAVDWFEGMMKKKTIVKHGLVKEGTMRHLRLYNLLISSLARDDLLKLAHHYFREANELENLMFTSRSKPLRYDTLISLLQCILNMQHENTYDRSDFYMRTTDTTREDVFNSVLDYINKWGIPLNDNLMNLISPILKTFSGFNVNYTTQVNYTCLNCNADLTASPSSFTHICNKVVSSIHDYTSAQKLNKQVRYLDGLMEEAEYFDVVIDGANVLTDHVRGPSDVPQIRNLNNLLFSVRANCKPRKVALILDKRLGDLETLMGFLDYVKDKTWFDFQLKAVIIKPYNDDIATCYLGAKSELRLEKLGRKVTIVSNDKFVDHRYFAGMDQGEYFLWLRHRKFNFDIRKGYLITEKEIPPVVRLENQNVHLISESGSVCCIEKT